MAGIELHANTVVSGHRTAAPPELPPHHQSHFTNLGVGEGLTAGANDLVAKTILGRSR